jgi:hypothetical protein
MTWRRNRCEELGKNHRKEWISVSEKFRIYAGRDTFLHMASVIVRNNLVLQIY